MATRYAESNVSLAFDANLASGFTTPGIATPGFEEVNDPLAPIVQPMQVGEDGLEGRVLPRADGGKDAWLVLIGCFTLEALVWGFVSHLNSLLAAETDSKLVSVVLRRLPELLLDPRAFQPRAIWHRGHFYNFQWYHVHGFATVGNSLPTIPEEQTSC
jgi:hypothetical protein